MTSSSEISPLTWKRLHWRVKLILQIPKSKLWIFQTNFYHYQRLERDSPLRREGDRQDQGRTEAARWSGQKSIRLTIILHMILVCTYVNFIFQVWEYIFEDFSIFGFYQYCIEVLVTYFHKDVKITKSSLKFDAEKMYSTVGGIMGTSRSFVWLIVLLMSSVGVILARFNVSSVISWCTLSTI